MEAPDHSYNGKTWRSAATTSDHNSFFHAAFGVKSEERGYFDKHANSKRMQWMAFLHHFENEAPPSCLEDTLRKCFSVNEKCTNMHGDLTQSFPQYISSLLSDKRAVTKEEVGILATLENIKVVILSQGGVTVVEPNSNILGSYTRAISKNKPREVVLHLEGGIFTRLEPVMKQARPKPMKIKVEKKTDPSRYEKGGSAGSKGVEYQINLITIVMLNAMEGALGGWKLSTENEKAGKFDDIVLEWTEGAVLIQSKHKEDSKKTITLEELTSTNPNHDDFSIPKYFLSYMTIKHKFNVKNAILCTNAGVHKNALIFFSRQPAPTESVLRHENGECWCYALNEAILPYLEEKTFEYYDRNYTNKDTPKSVITKENLTDFLRKFQIYFEYPQLKTLKKINENLLSSMPCCATPEKKINLLEVSSKLTDWFQQKDGVYFTEMHAKAIFADIWTKRFCENLSRYKVTFQKNEMNFKDTKQIFYIPASADNLLRAIKVYDALQMEKMLVSPDDDIVNQKLILDAFSIPLYVFLVIIQTTVIEESIIAELCDKLRDVLKKKYKKIILMTRNNDAFAKCLTHDEEYKTIELSVTFANLSDDFQEGLLKRKSTVFQGKSVCLEDLLATRITKDYVNSIDENTLEKVVKGEAVTVGVRPKDMDQNIAPFYITRTFRRYLEKIHENDIYDVKDKAVLISDGAGVGKTTVLSKLAINLKEKHPQLWVIQIPLTEYTHLLKKLKENEEPVNVMKLLNSRDATNLTNNLESLVFSMEAKVVLMFDGVDEISPDYTELVHGLLTECQKAANIAKLFVTMRPYKVQELKEKLNVEPFELQPFAEGDQVHFLVDYWTHTLNIPQENQEKCEKYARALVEKMSSWTRDDYSHEKFTAIALQLRMVAEIFQESKMLSSSSDWNGCREYSEGPNEVPNLPREIELKALYDLFIERKRNIYVQKGNPGGSSEANSALNATFDASLARHHALALETILNEDDRRLLSCYEESSGVVNETVLKVGIVQGSPDRFYFIHRTFAEYFVAESLIKELQLQSETPNQYFQEFFIDDVLRSTNYEMIRAFLESFLQNVIGGIPSDIFKKYQSSSTNYLYRPNVVAEADFVVNVLFREGHVTILQLFLNCIGFEIMEDPHSRKDRHQQKDVDLETLLTTLKRERMHVNTLNMLKILLDDQGLEFWDWLGKTPLVATARGGHLKMVKFLVARGVGVNSTDKQGITALHWAVESGHTDIARYLIRHHAQIDYKSQDGFTPLHYAAARNVLDCFNILIESGADVTIRDTREHTALHFAAMARSDKSPMDLTVRMAQQAIIELLVKRTGYVNLKGKFGYTPLHFAAIYSHVDIVKLLHDLGGDVTIRDSLGKTALHLAAEMGNLDCVKYLLKYNDVNIKDANGCTPLFSAAICNQTDIVLFLLEQKADVASRNDSGKTALHVLAENGFIDDYFAELVDDVNAKDDAGCTALHLAAQKGHVCEVIRLCEMGADVNVKNNDAKTPLHLAVEIIANLRTVKVLHKFGAYLNVRDGSGRTPLHSAALSVYFPTFNYLRQAGADFRIKDKDGLTPIQIACF